MKAVADNDVLLKGVCYGLLELFISRVSGGGAVGVLGTSRFVVPARITRSKLSTNVAVVHARFMEFLAGHEVVEPDEREQRLAIVLESTAQRMGLSLDAGESQLVAVLVSRSIPWFLTGDKRAIASIELLLDVEALLIVLVGKVKCLEQLAVDAVGAAGLVKIREAICNEPSVDRTLSICFGCAGSAAPTALEGLHSYINDLRKTAARVLAI